MAVMLETRPAKLAAAIYFKKFASTYACRQPVRRRLVMNVFCRKSGKVSLLSRAHRDSG